MVAGLVWQVVSMTLFLALWADFALKVRKSKASGTSTKDQNDGYAVLRDSRKFTIFQMCKPPSISYQDCWDARMLRM